MCRWDAANSIMILINTFEFEILISLPMNSVFILRESGLGRVFNAIRSILEID